MSYQFKFSKYDEWYTPSYAVDPIIKYLKPQSTIWCPFDTSESEFVKVLKDNGFEVIHTHIKEGGDFFSISPPGCDYIVSNPPYSLKTEIFERLIEIDIPFAMLINSQGVFDSKRRFELFKDKDVNIIYLYPRVSYFRDGYDKRSVPFQSCYLCYKMICQNEFEYLKGEKSDGRKKNVCQDNNR